MTETKQDDVLELGGHAFHSRFILGSGKYSLALIEAAVRDAGAEIVTCAVRRANTKEHENILDYIPKGVTLLPNTSGARTADEAVRIAHLARELGCGDFVKIEIMRDSKYLLPDNEATIRATETLANEGFVVLPYMYPDLNVARDLVNVGAAAVMPLAAPIGSNKGRASSSRSSSTRLMRPSSSMRASAARRRPARPCRWAQRPSWRTRRSRRRATCRSWHRRSKMRLRPAARRTAPASAACSRAAQRHPTR